ncbi:MAG: Hsp20/alpha crystallin family protein [Clostridia bacterium]|nr:Hsp20/alpha crystallin family protein [Clostridia bacterium]
MFTLMPRNSFFDDFDDFFTSPGLFKNAGASRSIMNTDVQEKDGLYLMSIDMPGYDKSQIRAELKDGYLTISASKEENVDESDDKTGYIHRERYQGSCSRSYYVGSDITDKDIKAAFKDGVLHLSFPKEAPKQIEEKKLISIE